MPFHPPLRRGPSPPVAAWAKLGANQREHSTELACPWGYWWWWLGHASRRHCPEQRWDSAKLQPLRTKPELEIAQEQVLSQSFIDSWFLVGFPALVLVKSRKYRDVGDARAKTLRAVPWKLNSVITPASTSWNSSFYATNESGTWSEFERLWSRGAGNVAIWE